MDEKGAKKSRSNQGEIKAIIDAIIDTDDTIISHFGASKKNAAILMTSGRS